MLGASDVLQDVEGFKGWSSWLNVENCDPAGGWFYDVDPAIGAPTRIMTCPTTCDAFQKTDMGSVKIELGCETRVVVK